VARTYVRRSGERVRRVNPDLKWYRPWFVDPFIWIQGSKPEKMVMAELVRRGIYFEHTPQTNSLPWRDWQLMTQPNIRTWEPDFLIPQYRIWIEVQGSYFHTLPGQVETDALRFAYIEAVGWRPIFWWDYDIEARLQDLFNAVPEFYNINRTFESSVQSSYRKNHGLPFYEGGDGIDHLAGLRTALRNRGRPPQYQPARYRRGRGIRVRRPK
jgi:very-short-patch-repair endonuclease